MIEWLDKKFNEPPKFSYFFKNFPDNQKLNFGFKMGSIISIIMTDAIPVNLHKNHGLKTANNILLL